MLYRSDQGRYGNLAEELKNYITKSNNDRAGNITEEYNLLVNHKTSYDSPTRGLIKVITLNLTGKITCHTPSTALRETSTGIIRGDILQTRNT